MSTTRHKTEDAPLRQERYASSQEFERGLLAAMVARRCSVLGAPADRALIWWLQFMSHLIGGLKALIADLLERYGDSVVTSAMQRIGRRTGNYSADQVREIRKDLPRSLHRRFLLKGEAISWDNKICAPEQLLTFEDMFTDEGDRAVAEAAALPVALPVAKFVQLCRGAAESGVEHDCMEKTDCLVDHLRKLCLDPAVEIASASPWYFADLVTTLRAYMTAWIADHQARTVVTTLGRKVCDVLDYTAHARTATLLEGTARIGKSYSARAWCEQHAGRARFIEVPTGNDETGFFRALARGLGLGNFQQYKAGEIRERIESVLLTGDLVLCLDEAHRLLPQLNFRYGYPKRIEWLLSMVNAGVPVCLVSQPGFVERLRRMSDQSTWNPAQFLGRLGHYESLPHELTIEDLMAVTKSVLPESDSQTRRALAAYARTSAKYLAAIESIAKRARYIASKAGCASATTKDVRRAMEESVIPADSNLVSALTKPVKPARRGGRRPRAEVPSAPASNPAFPHREIAPPGTYQNRLANEALELADKE